MAINGLIVESSEDISTELLREHHLRQRIRRNGFFLLGRSQTKKLISESCTMKPNLNDNFTFSTDMSTTGIPSCVKSSEKCNYNRNFFQSNKIF